MSIFSSLIPEANPNHNVFDLSRRDVYSIKSAMVNVCFVQHTIPNARYEITPDNQIEVSTMAKANFARLKQNLEYYFVPYSQLWRWFESFYYQRNDVVRNPHNTPNMAIPTNVPHFNLSHLIDFLYMSYVYQFMFNSLLSAVQQVGADRLQFQRVQPSEDDFTDFNHLVKYVLQDTAVACYFNAGADHNYDMMVKQFVDVHNVPACENALRLLDNLGYGNFLPLFKRVFNGEISYQNEYFTSADDYYSKLVNVVSTAFQSSLSSNESLVDFADRLSDYYGESYHFDLEYFIGNSYHSQSFTSDVKPNAFPILAYLKVWSDNFRNVQYDNDNYSFYYNIDNLLSAGELDIPVGKILHCLIPRYRLYRRDIVTGTYPNAQFGDAALASIQNPTSISRVGNPPATAQNLVVAPNSSPRAGNVVMIDSAEDASTQWNINSGISALAIRQAEALQRYREKNLRAGARLTNQQNAFFGDRSKFMQDDYSEFLYSTDAQVMINSIVATAESDEISLGDKGGYSFSALNAKSFTFNSHDFGVIIGIQYVLPVAEYENYGLDPQVCKVENGDYFHPDLQNLGLSPVWNLMFNLINPDERNINIPLRVLGYSAHDWEYKTAVDRVHGEFNDINGIFGDYVTPRDRKLTERLTLQTLYTSPSDIDNIFVTSSDSTQASDQFKVNMYHRVKAVLPMSVTGLPY